MSIILCTGCTAAGDRAQSLAMLRATKDGGGCTEITRPSALGMSDPVMEFLEILDTQEFSDFLNNFVLFCEKREKVNSRCRRQIGLVWSVNVIFVILEPSACQIIA